MIHTCSLTTRLVSVARSRAAGGIVAGLIPRVMVVQVRHKQNKPRYRAPSEGKERQRRMNPRKMLAPFENTQDPNDEKFSAPHPEDDVWIRANYPIQEHSLVEAITRHQQYAQPTMFDNGEGVLYADLSLNMATAKKTKFVKPSKETILLPHRFTYKEPNKCAVFCQLDEDIECALQHGAAYAGGDKLLRMFADDTITREDYDFVLATPDMVTKITTVRSRLRDLYPSERNGTMGEDVGQMVTHFTHGFTVEAQPTSSESVTRIQVPIGQFKMATEELVENFKFYIKTLGDSRPVKAVGQMVQQAFIIAPPSPEVFYLRDSEYIYRKPRARASKKEELEEGNEEGNEEDVEQQAA